MQHHGGSTPLVYVGELPCLGSHGDLEQKKIVGICPVPLDDWDHVQARTVMHVPPRLKTRASARGNHPLTVVTEVTPGAGAAMIGPGRRAAHVRKDVVHSALGPRSPVVAAV